LGLAAGWLHPLPVVGQQGRQILAKAIGEKQRGTVGSQHLCDLVDHALRHGERAIPDVDRQQQLALRVHRDPHPLGRTLQTLDGLRLTDLAGLDSAEQGKEFVQLHLPGPYVVQDVAGEGLQLLCSFD
jgi:hypothetical protein